MKKILFNLMKYVKNGPLGSEKSVLAPVNFINYQYFCMKCKENLFFDLKLFTEMKNVLPFLRKSIFRKVDANSGHF